MSLDLDDLRLAVYRDLARTGRAPTATELASRLDLRVPEVRDGLHALAAAHHLVLDADDFGRIIADFPQAEADLRRIATSRR